MTQVRGQATTAE